MTDLEAKVLQATFCMTRQCWEQGMFSFALLETGCREAQDLVVYDMVVRQSADGRLCNVENTPAVTDSSFCIPATLESGARLNAETYKEAAQKNIDYLLNDAPRAADGTLYHMAESTQVWADSAAFLPYSLAITGHAEAALVQMQGILKRLYLPETGLYAHIWEDGSDQMIDGTAWGVGNGWILGGLLRTSLALSEKDKAAADWMAETFQKLLDAMLAFETEEGAFHFTMDDASTFVDSEPSAMVVCAIYDALLAGLLPDDYAAVADRIRAYVLSRVDDCGRVLGSSGSPDFAHEGTSVECQAHVLMMEEKHRLWESKSSL